MMNNLIDASKAFENDNQVTLMDNVNTYEIFITMFKNKKYQKLIEKSLKLIFIYVRFLKDKKFMFD